MRGRFYSNRAYLANASVRSIAGEWSTELHLVSGATYRRRYSSADIPSGRTYANARGWRLCDGRLPEFQPRVTYDEACRWILAAPLEGRVAVALEVQGEDDAGDELIDYHAPGAPGADGRGNTKRGKR